MVLAGAGCCCCDLCPFVYLSASMGECVVVVFGGLPWPCAAVAAAAATLSCSQPPTHPLTHPPMHPPTQPIFRYPDVWEFYKKAMASFWTVDEVDLGQDMRDWLTLRSE